MKTIGLTLLIELFIWLMISLAPATSFAMIDGITGTTFNLTAKTGRIITGDGMSYLSWGFAEGNGRSQYPGPTLIVHEGEFITINLVNQLTQPVSIVFPGQTGVTATGGTAGVLTREAPPGGTVQYTFTASQAGTYLYQSGTQQDVQIEMGLIGALIVRPMMPGHHYAYDHTDSFFNYETLFLLTEMDPRVHDMVERGKLNQIDSTAYQPVNWFINGRNAPDTMLPAFSPLLPNQPYDCMPRIHPGEKLLLRLIGGGRDLHPFHMHGNNAWVIARDGRLLQSAPGAGTDLAESNFTITVAPGETVDALFTWTGEKLGWDMYGHQQDLDNAPTGNFPGSEDVDHNGNGVLDTVPLEANEYAPDHGKPFPVILPNQEDTTFGAMYSGSPYLGSMGALPPGDGGFNMNGGFFYMWHSHNEKEMTSDDIFPGGMMTMFIVEPNGVPISH